MPPTWFIAGDAGRAFRLEELRTLARQGVVTPQTELQSALNGERVVAANVPGLFTFAVAGSAPPSDAGEDPALRRRPASKTLPALVVVIAVILIACVLGGIALERERRFRAEVEAKLARAAAALKANELEQAQVLVEEVRNLAPDSVEAANLARAIAHARALENRTLDNATGWQTVEAALERGDVALAAHLLRTRFGRQDPKAGPLLAECEVYLSQNQGGVKITHWSDDALTEIVREQGALPEGQRPRHPQLAKLTQRRWLVRVEAELERRRVEQAAKEQAFREAFQEGMEAAWLKAGEWADEAVREWLVRARLAALARLQDERTVHRKNDRRWRQEARRFNVMAMVPAEAAVVVYVPHPRRAVERLEALAIDLQLEPQFRFAERIVHGFSKSVIPWNVDLARPLAVVYDPVGPAPAFDLNSIVFVIPVDSDKAAGRALKTAGDAAVASDMSVQCGAGGLLALGAQPTWARMRGSYVCFGGNRATVDRVATNHPITVSLTAEAGKIVESSDIAFLVKPTAWRSAWQWFLGGTLQGLAGADEELATQQTARFLALADSIEYGAAAVQFEGGIELTACALFNPERDEEVENVIPLLLTSQSPPKLNGLPAERAVWAFSASGDGPSNVVIAHSLLIVAVDHFLTPQSHPRDRTPWQQAILKVFRHVQGARGAMYITPDPAAIGAALPLSDPRARFEILLIVDAAKPQELLAELRALVQEWNSQLPPAGDEEALHWSEEAMGKQQVQTLHLAVDELRFAVLERSIVIHTGDTIDLLEKCCRLYDKTGSSFAAHPAISGRTRLLEIDPRVRFFISPQYFILHPPGVALPASPTSYVCTELSLDLTRIRLDLSMPASELRPFARLVPTLPK